MLVKKTKKSFSMIDRSRHSNLDEPLMNSDHQIDLVEESMRTHTHTSSPDTMHAAQEFNPNFKRDKERDNLLNYHEDQSSVVRSFS